MTSSVSAQTDSKAGGGVTPAETPAADLPVNPRAAQPAGIVGSSGAGDISGASDMAGAGDTAAPGLVCPIIGLNSGAITAGAIPALSELSRRVTALNQRLQQQAASNPQCALAGSSASNFVRSVGSGSCTSNPVNCSQNINEVVGSYVGCGAGDRDELIDITLSTVMAFGAGTPIGVLGLGLSAVNSVIRLFRGRSQERAQENSQRETRLAQQTFVDGLASCAASDLYSSSVCTGPARERIGEALFRTLNYRTPCTAPISAPTQQQSRELLTSLRTVDTCLTAPAADAQACFRALPPATETNALNKAACLMTNTGGSFGEALEDTQNANLQDSLQMARRFHIQKILSLREEANREDDPRVREQLILNCYMGRLSMSVSANRNQESNDLVAGTDRRTNELALQDQADDRAVYRGYPDRSDDPNVTVRPPRLAPSFATAQQICSQLDACFRGQDTFSSNDFSGSNLRAKMCRGLARLGDTNGLLRQYNAMAFDIDVNQEQISCRSPAAVPAAPERPADGTSVNPT